SAFRLCVSGVGALLASAPAAGRLAAAPLVAGLASAAASALSAAARTAAGLSDVTLAGEGWNRPGLVASPCAGASVPSSPALLAAWTLPIVARSKSASESAPL